MSNPKIIKQNLKNSANDRRTHAVIESSKIIFVYIFIISSSPSFYLYIFSYFLHLIELRDSIKAKAKRDL